MRTFVQVLGDLPGGRTVDELTEALSRLVLEVAQTQRKGSLTLKLDIAPNADNLVTIDDTITLKLPQRARGRAIFYFDEEGSLLKDNPKQGKLFRAVETKSAEPPRRVATGAGLSGKAALAVAEQAAEDKTEAAG